MTLNLNAILMSVEKLAATYCTKHRIDCVINDVMCANRRKTVALAKDNDKDNEKTMTKTMKIQ